MCGYLGFFSNEKNISTLTEKLSKAFDLLKSRGPDSYGLVSENGIYCGFRRLAIIDPIARSDQPFKSKCGNYLLCFNGEIYNYKELSKLLINKNVKLKTTSDTEVILELYILYKEKVLDFLRGMFSIMIFNRRLNKVFFARDHFGIKPLYYSLTNEGLIICSQVKPLVSSGLVKNKINSSSRKALYFLGSIPEPSTYFENIHSVKSGQYLYYDLDEKKLIKKQWFNLNKSFKNKKNIKISSETISNFRNTILDSISSHCIADTNIGLFYSNGLDSNLIYNSIKNLFDYKVSNFSINFKDGSYDEIKNIDKSIGNHSLFTKEISHEDVQNDMENIFKSMDQPSIDGTNVWYVSKLARENKIKTVLSGLGADEIFNGYNILNRVDLLHKNKFLVLFVKLLKYFSKINKDKLNLLDIYYKNRSHIWLLLRSFIPVNKLKDMGVISEDENIIDMIFNNLDLNIEDDTTFLEINFYLKNQLLRDTDWASMAHGVEVRVPFVDIELFKLITKYDLHSKYKNKVNFYSHIFGDIIPKKLFKYKKKGFKQPNYNWYKSTVNTKFDYVSNIEIEYIKSL
tara:strand:+ start:884 stop:2593 length:1710 start_codon:yes stop_codon:yes gene_type:complete